MDTNIVAAALRSKQGASFEIFRRLRLGEWTAIISNHLLYEYEEVLKRQCVVTGFRLEDVDELLNAICARSEEWPLSREWQPMLPDPDDEPLVQLAVESGAMAIITHNVRHLQPAAVLNIQILKPNEFLTILQKRS